MEIRRYTSYPAALDELSRTLRARKFDPNEYYIVITPDRYTQGVEKALFGGTGAIDCEALTLSRLARRIAGQGAGLSREGGVMLVARAISNVKDNLTYYKRAAKYPDFARAVYDALMQIKSSDETPESLRASGVTKSKLCDLALIKSEYDKLKTDGKDASDRLDELARAVPHSELIKNSHIYAIGFSQGGADTTRLNKRVFSAMAKYAKSFLYMQAEPTPPRDGMEIFCAPDRITQYKQVATAVRKHIYEGGRYGDISIICPEPRALYRILREYNIPFYGDEASPLSETPPLIALSYIYRLKAAADSDTLISLCKNPYSGCDELDAQRLQLYLTERGISYGVMDERIEDEGAARAAERVKKLIGMLDGRFSDGVRNIIEKGEFYAIQSEIDPNGTDAITPVLDLVELLESYGAGDFDTDAMSFFSAASAVDIKSVPRERDRVNVTMPQTLRLTACKMLFVTDFNEGTLPNITADTGLLADNELDEITVNGGCVEPTALEQNRRNRAELAAVVHNAEKVFCSYATAGNARPAAFMETLAKKNTIIYKDYSELSATLRSTDDINLIAEYACVDGAARELAARHAVKHAASLRKAADCAVTARPFEPSVGEIRKQTLSVSELTHWFKCPYKRFLSDGIGLKERKTLELGAPDFGIIVHEFMRVFIAESDGEYDCSVQNVSRIIDRVLAEKGITLDPETYSRIVSDAADYARINADIIEAGDYKPAEFEKGFGGKLTLGKNKVKFAGVIDRVDVCGGKARIIDYKTGKKKFDIKECLNGNDMQLPLYSAALDMPVTGMFYVRLSPRYDNKERAMSGCMVKDVPIAVEYDRALAEGGTSEVVPVRTKLDKDGGVEFCGANGALLEREAFVELKRVCIATASQAADEIQTGYIARTPVAGACGYCAYRGICGNTVVPRGKYAEEEEE